MPPGRVLTRPEQRLPRDRYDLLIVGGGVLGLCCAFWALQLEPDAAVLVVERDGVPAEEGATVVSPAVVRRAPPDPGETASATAWALERLERWAELTAAGTVAPDPFWQVGWLDLDASAAAATGTSEERGAVRTVRPGSWLGTDARAAVEALLGPLPDEARFDPRGGYANAEAVALHAGYAAVRRGAELLLNGDAQPEDGHRFRIDRTAFDRQMRRRVAATSRVVADRVVVAAGAAGAALVEQGLGRMLRLPRAYFQYPRLDDDPRLPICDGRVALPVLHRSGVTLRPQGEGLLLALPEPPPDPDGYRPGGGTLFGVRLGLRREHLEALLDCGLPVAEHPRLDLGKTVARVRGAWQVLGPARAEDLGDGWTLLVGGHDDFLAGLAAARRAAGLAWGETRTPW